MSEMLVCQGCGTALQRRGRGRSPKWCSQRCRKQTLYAGTCVDCGARTSGSAGIGKASRRCDPCARRHQTEHAKWTRDRIIAAIREWADRYGHPPSAEDWNPAQARARGQYERVARFMLDGDWPSQTVVQQKFGRWNAAIAAAGFDPLSAGQQYQARQVPAAELVETIRLYESGLTIRQVAAKLGLSETGVYNRLVNAGVARRSRGPRVGAAA